MSEMNRIPTYNPHVVIAGIATVDQEGMLHMFPLVEETRLKDIKDKDKYITIGDKLILPAQFYQNVMPCNKQLFEDFINEQQAAMSGDNI